MNPYQIASFLVINLLMLVVYIVSVAAQLNGLKSLPPVRRILAAVQHVIVLLITTAAYITFLILFNSH